MREAGFADGDQFAVWGYGFHVARALAGVEWRDAEIAAVADLGCGDVIDHFGGKFGEQLRRRDHGFIEAAGLGELAELVNGVGAFDFEIAGGGAAQGF